MNKITIPSIKRDVNHLDIKKGRSSSNDQRKRKPKGPDKPHRDYSLSRSYYASGDKYLQISTLEPIKLILYYHISQLLD